MSILKKRRHPDPPPRIYTRRVRRSLDGDQPFTLHADGMGWFYVATGFKDGPLPTHYEPLESLVENPLYGRRRIPCRSQERSDNAYARRTSRFPYVLTTYRLTEHHTAGGMSRHLSP